MNRKLDESGKVNRSELETTTASLIHEQEQNLG